MDLLQKVESALADAFRESLGLLPENPRASPRSRSVCNSSSPQLGRSPGLPEESEVRPRKTPNGIVVRCDTLRTCVPRRFPL
jgi:hypothetical protein